MCRVPWRLADFVPTNSLCNIARRQTAKWVFRPDFRSQ